MGLSTAQCFWEAFSVTKLLACLADLRVYVPMKVLVLALVLVYAFAIVSLYVSLLISKSSFSSIVSITCVSSSLQPCLSTASLQFPTALRCCADASF